MAGHRLATGVKRFTLTPSSFPIKAMGTWLRLGWLRSSMPRPGENITVIFVNTLSMDDRGQMAPTTLQDEDNHFLTDGIRRPLVIRSGL